MILSKYDSDVDLYQYYHFKGDEVTYGKLHLEARTNKHIRKWTHELSELGWNSRENYINHLKKIGFKEVARCKLGQSSKQLTVLTGKLA